MKSVMRDAGQEWFRQSKNTGQGPKPGQNGTSEEIKAAQNIRSTVSSRRDVKAGRG